MTRLPFAAALLLLPVSLPMSLPAHAETFRVDGLPPGDELTIRERPDAEAPAVLRVPANARLVGFGCTNATPSGLTWCRVRTGRSVGWARRRYLAPD